jgi:hypothetical protein
MDVEFSLPTLIVLMRALLQTAFAGAVPSYEACVLAI